MDADKDPELVYQVVVAYPVGDREVEPILGPVNEISVRFLDRYRDLPVEKLAAVPVDSVDRAKAPPIGV